MQIIVKYGVFCEDLLNHEVKKFPKAYSGTKQNIMASVWNIAESEISSFILISLEKYT